MRSVDFPSRLTIMYVIVDDWYNKATIYTLKQLLRNSCGLDVRTFQVAEA